MRARSRAARSALVLSFSRASSAASRAERAEKDRGLARAPTTSRPARMAFCLMSLSAPGSVFPTRTVRGRQPVPSVRMISRHCASPSSTSRNSQSKWRPGRKPGQVLCRADGTHREIELDGPFDQLGPQFIVAARDERAEPAGRRRSLVRVGQTISSKPRASPGPDMTGANLPRMQPVTRASHAGFLACQIRKQLETGGIVVVVVADGRNRRGPLVAIGHVLRNR